MITGLILMLAAALSAYLLSIFHLGLVNNGDGGRVLRSAFVLWEDAGAQAHLQARFHMQPIATETLAKVIPLSPTALLAMALALVSKLLGAQEFYLVILTSVYFTLFYAGTLLLFLELNSYARAVLVFVVIVFLVDPFAVSYFFSPYEEALAIALLPLWCYSSVKAIKSKQCVGLFLSTTLIIVALKSVFVVLLLLPAVFCFVHWKLSYLIGVVLVLAAAILTLVKSEALYNRPNSFNRLYNGLAYSLSDVSQWSEQSFVDRRREAPNLVQADKFEKTGLPRFALGKWGHSYWPDSYSNSEAEMIEFADLGSRTKFAELLLLHPYLGFKLLDEAFETAVVSDYRLQYIEGVDSSATGCGILLWDIFSPVHLRLGILFVLAALFLPLSLYAACPVSTVLLTCAILSPGIVVLGDGYFEFEKHLFPFFFLVVFSVPLIVNGLTRISHRG